MVRALQVLRIHLLELEKVQELCKDFCSKYIACIKEKMKCEHVLKTEYGGYDSDEETGYLTSKNKLIDVPVSRQSLHYCNNLNMRSVRSSFLKAKDTTRHQQLSYERAYPVGSTHIPRHQCFINCANLSVDLSG